MAEAVADGTVGVRFAFTLGCVELVTLGAFERTLLALPRDLVEAVLLDGYFFGAFVGHTVGVQFAFTLRPELVTLGAFERTLLALPRDLAEAVLLDGG